MDAEFFEDAGGDAVGLLGEGEEEVFGGEFLVVALFGEAEAVLQGFLEFGGHFVGLHGEGRMTKICVFSRWGDPEDEKILRRKRSVFGGLAG